MSNLLLILPSVSLVLCSSFAFSTRKQDNRTLPCKITENGKSVIFDCTGRRLKYVPFPIAYASESAQLLLSQNLIRTIHKTSFQNWNNLTSINLNSNYYPKENTDDVDICKRGLIFENQPFSNLTKLKRLFIDRSFLCAIPSGLPSTLKVLSLKYNNIVSIGNDRLSQLKHLKELYLDNNCYYGNGCDQVFHIENGTITELRQLYILSVSFNNLTTIPDNLPASLRELYLSNNNIQVVSRDDLKNLVNLEVLHLNGNCPRCFNANYPCKPCSGQSSIKIDPYAFLSLRNLTELHLGSTSLRSVPCTWFQSMSRLKVLNLEFNYLVKEMAFADFLRKLPFLEILDLSFNYDLRSYPRHINISENFSHLFSLTELHIQGYVFKEISTQNLAPLTTLKKLKIINFGINFIRQIDFKVFQSFFNLSLIYLSENRISPFSENRSRNVDVYQTQQFMQQLRDDIVSTDFAVTSGYHFTKSKKYANHKCLSYGKTLDLSFNSIFFIDPEQFRPFPDIACLNLSSNSIGQNLNGSEFIYLSKLTYLDLSFNKLDFASFNAFQELPRLKVLDLSYNKHYFLVNGVTHHLEFIENLHQLNILNLSWNEISTLTESQLKSYSLKELRFAGNRLDILWKDGDTRYREIFKNFYNLTKLDISHNRLKELREEEFRNLPPGITKLYLNNNGLTSIDWTELMQFQHLKHLDLSHNKLTVLIRNISTQMYSLKTLILSNNMISSLPAAFLQGARNLVKLDLSNNDFQIMNKSVFLSGSENYLKELRLKGNPFDCTCEITDFISWIYANNVTIPRLATDVTCATPENRKGSGIIYFDVHTCDLDSTSMMLFFLSFVLVINITILPILKNLFYWDLWYAYHLCVSKLGWQKVCKPECLYDVFIAYDNKDKDVNDWIFNELCHHLEERGDKHMHLCLEERDWEPGKAIIDNLAHSINQSEKTLFVLTRKYVKSGKFKTAFYLALQRLMDENVDVIVIVLLEPVLQNSQYLRLRKKICKSSIMEWPRNPHAKGFFWQKIKHVLLTENCKRYNNLYTDTMAP